MSDNMNDNDDMIEFSRTMNEVRIWVRHSGNEGAYPDPMICIGQSDEAEDVEILLHPEQVPLLIEWLVTAQQTIHAHKLIG